MTMKQFMTRDEEVDQKFLDEIKENPKALYKNDIDKKEKGYMILYYAHDSKSDENLKSWEVKYGRKDTYDFIKSMIEYIDLDNSKVVVEGTSFDDAKSAYEFMKFVSQYMDDPKFNIDDYYIKDNNEGEE